MAIIVYPCYCLEGIIYTQTDSRTVCPRIPARRYVALRCTGANYLWIDEMPLSFAFRTGLPTIEDIASI